MATYKRYYKNDILLGTGTYKYRPYTVLTPTVALTFNLTGCSTTATSANRLGETTISFTKSAGYNWPTTVQVTGATMVSWNHDTGVLAIEKPTLNTVTITVACTKITYSITENLTNVTATGTHPTSIAYGESVTLIYAASTNYKLPDTITVTGATHTWANDSGTLVLSNPTGDVAITITGVVSAQKLDTPQNLSISGDILTFDEVDHAEEYEVYANGISIGTYTPGAVTYPAKGDLIMLDGKQYRVLKINGAIAEVLAMYVTTVPKQFDTAGSSNVYVNSFLDTNLKYDFYKSLSTAIQNAIVEKTFQQDSWYPESKSGAIAKYNGTFNSGATDYTLSLISTTFGESISRKCYALSCQDIIDYLEVTPAMVSSNTTLTSENIWKMFWNQTTAPTGDSLWLRSAYSDDSTLVFSIYNIDGSVLDCPVDNSGSVRGAFQIDLSKVEWTKNS